MQLVPGDAVRPGDQFDAAGDLEVAESGKSGEAIVVGYGPLRLIGGQWW